MPEYIKRFYSTNLWVYCLDALVRVSVERLHNYTHTYWVANVLILTKVLSGKYRRLARIKAIIRNSASAGKNE